MTNAGPHILIVDDNSDDRALAARALRRAQAGIQISAAGDEADLVRLLDAHTFDLVITDYYLTKITGMQVLEHVRSRWPDCPVVMFTGTGNEEIAVEALKAGADDYIIKTPSHYARLATAVQTLLEREANRVHAKRLEQRLDGLLSRLNVGIFRATCTGTILEANPTFSKLLGCDWNTTVERVHVRTAVTKLLRLHEDDDVLERLQAGGRIDSRGVELLRLDGTIRRVSISLVLGEPHAGEPTIAAHVEDVTELVEAQQAADREHERLQAVVRSIRDGIVALDGDGNVLLANEVGDRHLQMLTSDGPDDPVTMLGGRPLGELLVPPPEGQLGHEIPIDEDPPIVLEVAAQPIEHDGLLGGWVFVTRDVSEHREQQQRMQRQSRLAAVGELAAGIAHDFNNTLQLITSFSRLIEMDAQLVGAAKIVEYSGHIFDAGMRASQIVGQILDFSRQSSSKRQALDLRRLVVDAMPLIRRGIPESIDFSLEATLDEHWAEADPSQIHQVVTNLVVNARDAMDHRGQLRIVLRDYTVEDGAVAPQIGMQPGGWHSLEVHDTGVGIPESARTHIFRPFFTTKREFGGTGLGLAQVSGIVQQHEGHITVHSEVGRGSCVAIHLPATGAGKAAPGEHVHEMTSIRGNGELMMIVEDEEAVLFAHTTLFEALGYSVVTARNGREALRAYKQYQDRMRVVVTDMVMPKMGGLELVRALRQQGSDVQVVVLTGYPLSGGWKEVWGEDVVDVLVKPLRMDKFARAIKRALAPQGEQQLHG